MRKKISRHIAPMISLAIIIACSGGCTASSPLPIDKMQWTFATLQNSDGVVVYCSQALQQLYPDATVKDLSCEIKGSKITISSAEDKQEWNGNLNVVKNSNKRTTIYEVEFEDKDIIQMTSSLTEHQNAAHEGTIVISSQTYTLYFYAPLIDNKSIRAGSLTL